MELSVVIDWVSALLPCSHLPLKSGSVFKVLPSGEIDWQTACALDVEGSYSSTIRVRSEGGDGQGRATHLYFHGNPSKFLQGHNVFGSDDLLSLMTDSYLKLCKSLDITPSIPDLNAVRKGNYTLSRLDLNYSFELNNRADVLAWLRAAEFKAKTRHGRPSRKGGTLYFGKTSRRWAFKFYAKAEELEVKGRFPDIFKETQIPDWADNKLRAELTLRTKELQTIELDKASTLTESTLQNVFREYIGRLEMNEQVPLSTEQEFKLPQRLRSTYILWRSGEDLRDTLPKTTYYRHRKDFLEYGIDIAIRKESIDRTNVVPLIRVLEAEPAVIPDWAFSENLIHNSARKLCL